MRSRSISWKFNKGKKNLLLTKWKTWKTGVNLIIHFNFPLSFGQYVKENERVCRDGTKAKGVIFYSKGELKFLYGKFLEKREYVDYEEEVRNSYQANYLLNGLFKKFFLKHLDFGF